MELGRTNIGNSVLFSFTFFPLGYHASNHSVRPNTSAISSLKLEVTDSLVIFIVIVYYISWFTSLSGWWIPLGEPLCHFNLPLVSSLVLPPLNSHSCIYSKGCRSHELHAQIRAFLRRMSWTWPISCHTLLSVTSHRHQWPLFLSSHRSSGMLRSFSFPDLLNCVPSQTFLLWQGGSCRRTWRLILFCTQQALCNVFNKWMGKWMFVENVHWKMLF